MLTYALAYTPQCPMPLGGAPPDPLAGISFSLRFETHNGDKVPKGLYTDTVGTVPVSADGDTVAAIRNWRGDNSIIYTQTVSAQRPIFHYGTNGYPIVSFDGVSQCMAGTVAATLPYTIATGAQAPSSSFALRMVTSQNHNCLLTFNSSGYGVYVQGDFIKDDTTFAGNNWGAGVLVEPATGNAAFYFNGTSYTDAAPGVHDWGTVGLNGAGAFAGFVAANMSCLFIAPSALSPTDRATVKAYIATLNPH